MFFIYTERFSDFGSMVERYEKEMRKMFETAPKEEPPYEKELAVIAPAAVETDKEQQAEKTDDAAGTIIAQVSTARGAVPLFGVTVVIDRLDTKDPQGRQELVAVELTDRDGRTKPVKVNTVSRELSLKPGSADPFSTFYVSTAEKGYEPVKSRPVDVFSGEISIIKIDLVPKPENLAGGETF